jgi:hypothetical protein
MWKATQNLTLAYNPFHYAVEGPKAGLWEYFKLFSPTYMKLPGKAFFAHILTPLGIFFAAFGLPGIRLKAERFIWVWLFSVVFYLLVMWPTAVIHPYYMLAIIPPLSFFVGQGAKNVFLNPNLAFKKHAWVWVFFCLIELISLGYYYRLLYFIPPDRQAIVTAGKVTDTLTPKNSLVIASWGASPIQLYYCNRKGWVFDLNQPDGQAVIDAFESLRGKGATHYVTTTLNELRQLPQFEKYLRSHYAMLKETDEMVIFDLRGVRGA